VEGTGLGDPRTLIPAEDAKIADEAARLLVGYGLAVSRFEIAPDATELPAGDLVVICGPKSAPAAANLLATDPVLDIRQGGGRWRIASRRSGEQWESPADSDQAVSADSALHRPACRTGPAKRPWRLLDRLRQLGSGRALDHPLHWQG
jgi:hypothetical protein